MCKSNKIPPRAEKDRPSYFSDVCAKIKKIEEDIIRYVMIESILARCVA